MVIDGHVRRLGDDALVGGWPTRLLRLAPAARDMVNGGRLVVVDRSSALVARRLLDTGIANPRPRGAVHQEADVTVIVPVRDRAAMLRRLLVSLSGGPPVIVVDDGSAAWRETESVAREHGARFMRHPNPRGPGAARNTGLAMVDTPLVAFIDSDCVASSHWLRSLLPHFDDPAVALVAPRIVALDVPHPHSRDVAAYERARSSLDLGPQEALVCSHGRLSWVPSAAMIARRAAIGAGFAEDMRVGEDVDLVWRLQEAGWQVRYEPSSLVEHEHRSSYRTWGMRKVHYGTSAAVLGRRHGRRVAPVVLSPWAALTWSLLLVQRRRTSLLAPVVVGGIGLALGLRLPSGAGHNRLVVSLLAKGFSSSGLQVASGLVRAWWPVTAAACLVCRSARRAVLVAAVVDALTDWVRHGRPMGMLSYALLRRADDIAYGTGLWLGVLREGSIRSLLPDFGLGRRQARC